MSTIVIKFRRLRFSKSLLISLQLTLIILINDCEINGDCSFPGIPNGIDVAHFKYLTYTENATAFYRCKDPNDIILTENNKNFGLKSYSSRYCSKGKRFNRRLIKKKHRNTTSNLMNQVNWL